ncbi:TlpA family protein disulfide reductase [Psychroflexus sp. ALD_RP9]|uniref:TlpA family protein disulfide reductase n=1 Tax=Psychroflexus sp. ALD_RP9 TaxID=2777186 RepID=UPI001A8F48AC|nr:thioredoxin family protein [Psychroflexus sp. ALD_RP9]QSS97566.1 thioredoxin family protein [Psychroflexus sp. ALD_RP9]
MKNIFKALFVLVITLTSNINGLHAQNYEIMLGEFSLEELKSTKNSTWYLKEYKSYNPNNRVVNQIASLDNLDELNIEIYLGTWCPDSRRELPRLVKILDLINFDKDELKMIGVTRSKKVPEITKEKAKQLNIINVPTIIVYKNGKELNRYVEFAVETIEKDLFKIMAEKDYIHSYDF